MHCIQCLCAFSPNFKLWSMTVACLKPSLKKKNARDKSVKSKCSKCLLSLSLFLGQSTNWKCHLSTQKHLPGLNLWNILMKMRSELPPVWWITAGCHFKSEGFDNTRWNKIPSTVLYANLFLKFLFTVPFSFPAFLNILCRGPSTVSCFFHDTKRIVR